MVAKRASVLVPFPYATDNHQELNAREMVEAGASLLLLESELDGDALADRVRSLAEDPGRVEAMERAAGRAGRPEAAREIVDACANLIAGGAR